MTETKQPVTCLTWTTARGKTKPLAIRFTDDQGIDREIIIDRVIEFKEHNFTGIPTREYVCEISPEGLPVRIKLGHHLETSRWEVWYN